LRVTVDRVAKKAGVSRALASSVLSGGIPQIRYSEKTRQRVQKAARELDYKPKSVNGLGLIHSMGPLSTRQTSWANWIGPMLESIHAEAARSNKLLSVFGYSSSEIDQMFGGPDGPQILKRRKVDGLILSGVFDEVLMAEIGKLGLPYVLMNVDNSDVHDTDAVFFDDLFAGRQATEYLIHRGHRRILHVSPDRSHEHYSIRHRRNGYQQAMQEADLLPRVVSAKLETPTSGYQMERSFCEPIQNALKAPNPPTAIFAYDEIVTISCHRILEELKLTKEDVAIITVGTNYSHLMKFAGIAQVQMPAGEVGRQAYRMLMDKQKSNESLPSIALRGSIKDC
jgi:DNA-binding LacI/PurR family transcriptional regulator